MVFKIIFVLVIWIIVASTLEGGFIFQVNFDVAVPSVLMGYLCYYHSQKGIIEVTYLVFIHTYLCLNNYI